MDVGLWLRGLGLEIYASAFAEHAVDAETLPLLSMEDLKEIGVVPVGHRRKILAAIATLSEPAPETAPETAPEVEPEPVTPPAAVSAPPVGAAAPPPAERAGTRREVTVLFADIVGYTKLSSRLDAEQLHAILSVYFDRVDAIISRLGGSIDKHIGDCVMAVFGAPVAHEDDVRRAVAAALAVHAAMPEVAAACGNPLAVHIGIASGEVLASSTGSSRHQEYTVTGDTVNLAARLTSLAGAGETVVSAGVFDTLGDLLAAVPLGEQSVKGLAQPVTAWRVEGLVSERSRGTRPMAGRRAELAQCRMALEVACAERRGAVIYIRGEAGIGKSRLLQAVFDEAQPLGFSCRRAAVFDFGSGLEADPLRAIGLSLRDGAGDGNPPLAVKDLLGLPLAADERRLLDAMPHRTRASARAEALAGLATKAAAARPLLIGVEDVHWADAVTLHGLDQLARSAPERAPLVLVMTSRLEEDPMAGAQMFLGGLSLLVIELGRLREQDARALAGSLLDSGDPVIDECIARAEGNPLFLEQLVRHARSDGARSSVPGSIRSVVLAQADRLGAADHAAARAAAVLGDQFSLASLQHLLQRQDYRADGLVAARLVRPDGDMLQFSHALIRDSLYSSILHTERRAIHGRAAAWFAGRDSSLHAEHLARAEEPGAVDAFIAAARELAAAYRPEAALDRIRRGAAAARIPAEHCALALEEAALLLDLGQAVEAAASCDRAADSAPDALAVAAARLGKAAALRVIDRVSDALRMLDEAEPAFVEAGDHTALARLEHLRGNLLFPLGHREPCRQAHERALRHARLAGAAELEVRALGGLGDAAYAAGLYASAERHFAACVEKARAEGLGRVEIANAPMLAITHAIYGNSKSVLAEVEACIAAAVSARQPRAEVIAHHIAMMIYLWAGRPERVGAHFERAEELTALIGARRFKPENMALMAEALRQQGDRRQAIALIEEAVPICRQTGLGYVGAMILGYRALMAYDDPETRASALEEGEALVAEGGLAHNALFFGQCAIESALLAGAWDEARRFAAGLERAFVEEPVPMIAFLAARGRLLADHGERPDDSAVRERMHACAQIGRQIGYGYFLAALDPDAGTRSVA